MLAEKEKTRQMKIQVDSFKALYEGKMQEIIDIKQAEKFELTKFYTKQINVMETEITT